MSVKLKKGSGISLSKGIENVQLNVTWNENIDIDIHCLVLKDGKVEEDEDFVFYYNLTHPSGAVVHSADSRAGGREFIDVDFSKLPPQKNEILLLASIDKAEIRGHHFGKANSSKCELIDINNNNEVLATCNFSEDLFGDINAKLVRLFKTSGIWHYEVLNKQFNSLEELLNSVGIQVVD